MISAVNKKVGSKLNVIITTLQMRGERVLQNYPPNASHGERELKID